ncbi:hypothetical protein J5226_24100 [Lysobacter sp. K5869]|uniref:hypothetical protein n=1 Tax=Lysobacter sp. K5869 TaxID=2820808 RepID=UPI001C0646A0|nr:hypothetical protein [Lysobacter sp. K5869]QWP76621.1 hypothetical protein J5226_24100 [Lysobacter sp. K5869]
MLSRWLFSLSWQETSAGRNLITLFATVNNPGDFFSAPPTRPARPARARASSSNARASRASRERISSTSLKPKRGAGFGAFAFFVFARRDARACVRERDEGVGDELYRKKKFLSAGASDFASHKPECAKVRELFSAATDRRSVGRDRALRSMRPPRTRAAAASDDVGERAARRARAGGEVGAAVSSPRRRAPNASRRHRGVRPNEMSRACRNARAATRGCARETLRESGARLSSRRTAAVFRAPPRFGAGARIGRRRGRTAATRVPVDAPACTARRPPHRRRPSDGANVASRKRAGLFPERKRCACENAGAPRTRFGCPRGGLRA